MIVLTKASAEKTNAKLVISASNNLAVKTDTNCDKPIPKIVPTTKEIIPTIIVSKTKIIETRKLDIPKVR